jgi:arginine N-succinyltransferase
MTWHVRPARAEDLDALHALAQQTGPGFTNIPQAYDGMAARLAWHLNSLKIALEAPGDNLYLLVLANEAGEIGGTAMLFAEIGVEWPFYSYHIARFAQTSKALKRTIASELLNLTTEFSGSSEVGGLFLRADLRAGGTGLGHLLARARYLFIAQHRARFGDRLIAELRGWLTPAGESPFWDALGRPFFEMGFPEANRFNVENGNQFIADLMPKHPVYIVMLPQSARTVMGRPHDSGAPAMRLLEREGFRYDRFIDIFDGGPTMCVHTDHVRTSSESHSGPLDPVPPEVPTRHIAAAGQLAGFRSWLTPAERAGVAWRLAQPYDLSPHEEVRCVAQ